MRVPCSLPLLTVTAFVCRGPRYFPRYNSARFVEQFSGRGADSGAGWAAIALQASLSDCKPSALPWRNSGRGEGLWREVQILHCWPHGVPAAVRPECPKLSRRQGCEGLGASEVLTRLPIFLGKSEVQYRTKNSHYPQRMGGSREKAASSTPEACWSIYRSE